MAPVKKSKPKKKKKKKSQTPKPPPSPAPASDDWWPSFLHRNPTSTPSFPHFFRVSAPTFSYICSLVRPDLVSRPPSGLINIEGRLLSVEKQVAIALRRLSSGLSQVSVGHSFSVGQSTVSQVTSRFVDSLESRARHHLSWPSSDCQTLTRTRLCDLFRIPDCCGAIAATKVVMTLPAVESSTDWRDKDRNYSMFVQGVVDEEMRFLDVVAGWPGGMSVSEVLKCSSFYKLCREGRRMEGGGYVAGGAAYPSLSWLARPEGTGDELDGRIEGVAVLAERAFARLKGVWRILHKVMWRPDKRRLPSIILVCCLLHNIMIDRKDEVGDDVVLRSRQDAGCDEEVCEEFDPEGRILRESLAKYLQDGGMTVV